MPPVVGLGVQPCFLSGQGAGKRSHYFQYHRSACSQPFRHLVSLAALITILGLAFEPFFQQIVAYPDRMVAVGPGSIWAASTFIPQFPVSTRQGSRNNGGDPAMTVAIDSVFNNPDADLSPPTTQCSTANCTWPTYSTLGVGHSCQDVSYLLEYHCKNNTDLLFSQGSVIATDPCGYKVNNTFVTGVVGNLGFRTVVTLSTVLVETLDLMPAGNNYWNSTVFGNSTLPILDFYIGYTPGGPEATLKNSTPVLLECLITCKLIYVSTSPEWLTDWSFCFQGTL